MLKKKKNSEYLKKYFLKQQTIHRGMEKETLPN